MRASSSKDAGTTSYRKRPALPRTGDSASCAAAAEGIIIAWDPAVLLTLNPLNMVRHLGNDSVPDTPTLPYPGSVPSGLS